MISIGYLHTQQKKVLQNHSKLFIVKYGHYLFPPFFLDCFSLSTTSIYLLGRPYSSERKRKPVRPVYNYIYVMTGLHVVLQGIVRTGPTVCKH